MSRVPINSDSHNVDEEFERRKYADFTTIDWVQDATLERNRRLRAAVQLEDASHRGPNGETTRAWAWKLIQKVGIATQSWVVVSLAGVVIGVSAALISILTEWLSDIKFGYCRDGWWLNQGLCCRERMSDEEAGCDSWEPWSSYTVVQWFAYVACASLFSWTAAYLVRSFARYAAGSGISEIKCILAGFVMKGYLGWWTFFIKSLTLPLIIASGLSVGKEGPSVHVACCVGYLVASLFPRFSRSQGKMRDMITAASAAGVAVAFGSPIGGVIFSIEEMSNSYTIKTLWRSFICALVATVTLSAMNPFHTGKLVMFQVTYDRDWHFFEIIFFVIIGIFGGVYGAFVIKFNLMVAAFRRKFLANHGVMEAVILATLTAMISFFNRFLRLDMSESLYILFRECSGGGDYGGLCQTWAQWRMANSLLLATIFRILLVIVSYGTKVPAGIFVPSMAVGATFGRMIGILVKAIHSQNPHSGWFAACDPNIPCITPGTYAFLGAAAALSGVMRITVTVVVIMFELTGALTYILPTMIVLLVTKAVGDWLGTTGIADKMIKFNGYPFLEEEEEISLNIPVSRVMKKRLHTMSAGGMTLAEVDRKLESTRVQGFPIISSDSQQALLGYIGRTELCYVLDKGREARQLGPETICEFVRESRANATEGGRTHLRRLDTDTLTPAWDASLETPLTQGGHEPDRDYLTGGTRTGLGIEDNDSEIELHLLREDRTGAGENVMRLEPWVNQTPLTVGPQTPLEIVVQLFKRLGPRVILVEKMGSLVGLITVKDVLRFIEREEAEHRAHARVPDRADMGLTSKLEGILEEVRTWVIQRISPLITR